MNYAKNFLTNVICKLDFADRLAALLLPDKPEFTKAIADEYPEIQDIKKVSISIPFGANSPKGGGVEQSVGHQWEHRKSADSKSTVVLSPEHFALECAQGGFTNFAQFREELEKLWNRLRNAHAGLSYSRVGLRYINQITFSEGSPIDWEGIINEALVDSVFASVPEPEVLARSMHQVTTRKDNIQSIFTYGIHNPDFPNVIARRHFVLDIDSSVSGSIANEDLFGVVDSLNKRCETIFESSIEDGLRNEMGVIHG